MSALLRDAPPFLGESLIHKSHSSAWPHARATRLLHRANSDDDPDCVGFCDSGYIRWIVAIIVIVFGVSIFILIWTLSIRRATGRWGFNRPEGGARFGRGGRRDAERGSHAREADQDPVPTYNATLSPTDAGHYDVHGNYIAFEPPPYEPPKAVLRTEEIELDRISAHTGEADTPPCFEHAHTTVDASVAAPAPAVSPGNAGDNDTHSLPGAAAAPTAAAPTDSVHSPANAPNEVVPLSQISHQPWH